MSTNSIRPQTTDHGRRITDDGPRRSVETWLTDFVAGLVPWIAPIPSAVLVANATVRHLHWSDPVAVIAGLVIEGLGLTATSTALTLWDWNGRRPEGEPKAAFWVSGVLVALYLVSTIGLTVVLDLNTALAHYAPSIFPLLALVGTINIALRSQHKHRLARIADVDRQAREDAEKAEAGRKAEAERLRLERKADREAKRQARLAGVSSEASNNRSIDSQSAKGVASRREQYEANLTALLDAYRVDQTLGVTEAASRFNVSRETIYNWKEELEKRGLIHENGKGLEVQP